MAEALAPAMLKPRGREYLFAPAIFSHIFACCYTLRRHVAYIQLELQVEYYRLRKKLTKHTSPARISRIELRSNTYVSRTSPTLIK